MILKTMRLNRNITIRISSIILLFTVSCFAAKGAPMSLFSTTKEVVLSSPMEGTLTLNGKPAVGIKIERRLKWFDGKEVNTDFVVTKNNGHFTLPTIKQTLKINSLVHFLISQDIVVMHQGEEISIWYMSKGSKIEYGELGGKPINLRCEITDEERASHDYNNPIMTRCVWDGLEPWTDTEYPTENK